MKKAFAWLLIMSLLCSMLCGCEGISDIMNTEESDTVVVKQAVDLYKKADFESEVVGSIRAGKKVEYTSTKRVDGVKWYKTEDGWFTMAGQDASEEEVATAPPVKGHVILTGFATLDLELLDSASSSAEVIGTMNAGSLVEIYQTRDLWAQTAKGWVLFENVYIPGHTGKNAGWCYIEESYLGCFSEPSFDSTRLSYLDAYLRVKLYEIIDISGVSWGYTESGWICLDDVYVEGTVGEGACHVKVIDKTPLNVRVGPSTKYDVVRALDVGSYVDVMAQVYNGQYYWGFIGDGWIYMDLVEVQE